MPTSAKQHQEMGVAKNTENNTGNDLSDVKLVESKKEEIKEDINILQEHYKGSKFYIVIVSLLMVLFVASLDIMIVATTIEKVAQRFNNYSQTSWLITGYSLPTAIMCLITARFAYQFTVKSALIIGVIFFEIGSLISALSVNMSMLIVGRCISGIGGSLIQNLIFVVVTQITPPEKVSLWTAIVALAFNISSVIGPILGSAFSDAYEAGWRLCFYINLPIGISAIILFMYAYNHENDHYIAGCTKIPGAVYQFFKKMGHLSNWKKFSISLFFDYDFLEFTACSIGFVLLFIGLTFGAGQEYAWDSYNVIVNLVLGPLFILLAILWDMIFFAKVCKKYQKRFSPLIDPLVFQKFGLIAVSICNFCACVGFMSAILFLIQYYQLVLDESTMDAGIRIIPMLISSSIVVMAGAIFIKKTGLFKVVIVCAAILGCIGTGLLQLSDFKMHADKVIGLTILAGCGFGGQVQSTMIASQYYIDKSSGNPDIIRMQTINITSFYSFVKLLGMATGSIIVNTYFDTRLYDLVQNSKELSFLHGMNVNEIIVYRLSNKGRDDALGKIIQRCIKSVWYVGLGFFLADFISSIFITNKRAVHEGSSKKVSQDLEEQHSVTESEYMSKKEESDESKVFV
ncbi:hypothetical protein QEN19_000766 [Hanseniaspora menglaensis]